MLQFLSKAMLIFIIGVVLLLVGFTLSKKELSNQMFLSPFECGFLPADTVKAPFSSRFFIMALVFLIFDVELILLFPALCFFQSFSLYSAVIFLFFINVLSLGLYYEWNASLLDWLY